MRARTEATKQVADRIDKELDTTDGRRVHVYKLTKEILEDAEMREAFWVELTTFGAVTQEPGIKSSRDGCAFSWVVFDEKEGAEAATEDDALALVLSTDRYTDEIFGYVNCEIVMAAESRERKLKAPLIQVKERGLVINQVTGSSDADIKIRCGDAECETDC